MNHHHLMGKYKHLFFHIEIYKILKLFSHNTSTGDDQALYSYPFGMEDDYKDFKVRINRIIFIELFRLVFFSFLGSIKFS